MTQNNPEYLNVRDAVAKASLIGGHPTVKELALAITSGLFSWPDQKEAMVDLAKALLEQTGEPYDVFNKAEQHE